MEKPVNRLPLLSGHLLSGIYPYETTTHNHVKKFVLEKATKDKNIQTQFYYYGFEVTPSSLRN